MAKPPATELTFPIGRLVQGSLTKPQDKDADGNALLVKNGPNKGQPRVDFFFAVAIPKNAGVPWWHEPWGQVLYNVGLAAFGQQTCSLTTFAWKIGDGDSTTPNTKGKKPCDSEGFPGNWIIYTSSGFAPPVYNAKGTALLTKDAIDSIKTGHYIQLAAKITSNESTSKPGIYINHDMVAYSGFGPEISVGRDPSAAGFGQGPVPAGMTAVPVQQAQFPAGAPAGPGAMPGPGPAAMPGPGPAMGAPGAMPGPAMGAPMAGPAGYPQPGPGPAMGAPGAMPGPGPAMGAPGAMPGAMPSPVAVTPNPAAMMPPAARNLNDRRMGAALQNNWDMNAMVQNNWTEQALVQAGHITPY